MFRIDILVNSGAPALSKVAENPLLSKHCDRQVIWVSSLTRLSLMQVSPTLTTATGGLAMPCHLPTSARSAGKVD